MNIALIGYGKMGKAIEGIARERGHNVVCIVDAHNADTFGGEDFQKADVAIEFTTPSTAFDNLLKSAERGVPVVCGTTGWLSKVDNIKRLCNDGKATVFYSSNYSIGVNVFFAVNRYLAKIMNRFSQYDVSMKEIHHIHKLDHPSGTAITLAEDIVAGIDRKNGWAERSEAADMVNIVSEREGEVPGTHLVEYRSEEDSIRICHEAFSRRGFALGAVLAAEWLSGRQGWFTMNDMLDF